MKMKKLNIDDIEGLMQDLSDEELAACVGGTGYVNPAGKSLGKGAQKKFSEELDGEDKNKSITYDPDGSFRSWGYWSDRNLKENFIPVDSQDVLEKVASLPIQNWNYKDENPNTRHIGPMAQDFAATFEVGESDRLINSVDANGVALAAIQALYQQLREKDAQIAAMRGEFQMLKQQVLENQLQTSTTVPAPALSRY